MGVYHQMGHDSWNLIDENSLSGYKGIVLSPVNDSPADVTARLGKLGKRRDSLEVILDPQFYKPSSDRGQLGSWPHFPDDVDTADLSDADWWAKRCEPLLEAAKQIGANAVCSPAMLPRAYNDDYYRLTADCSNHLYALADSTTIDVLITAIVHIPELAMPGRPEQIASILTSTKVSRVYLVLHDDLDPKTQRKDFLGLAGAIKLIRALEEAGSQVLVAFSGLDMLLWKAASASDVATGKFFNLRRFVPGRWDDISEGGRVVPYWTDGQLITWLREADLKLLDLRGFIDRALSASNPYARKILAIIDAGEGDAWVALGWRQYLYWFYETEKALNDDSALAHGMLANADTIWTKISDSRFYLLDRQNNGDWIRPWLNAIQLASTS